MKLGVCYYPEHWPSERWPMDAQLMRQAGLSLVRIAEFAWAKMEPTEGKFTWDWLDRAIDVLAAEGLQIVIGTPTAAPPVWLCRAHPDILPVDAQGRRRRYGSRRHYCASSLVYREHTVRIVAALAARYGKHPAVVGWQMDNELGWGGTARCYCDVCVAAFRLWLETKYGSLDDLNQAWGTVFWSQTYGKWNEIELPNLTVAEPNPSHVLDYYRFSSDACVSYQQLQISTLRPLISESQFVTTNFMCQYSDLNYHHLARPLDLVSVSSYPGGHAETRTSLYGPSGALPAFASDVGDPYLTGFWLATMRGFRPGLPFWVMEQQCGNVNWTHYNTGVRPGTTRLWTWHALASGADAVLYFRWRAGLLAQEQMHSGLLHHDASPAIGYEDLMAMGVDRALMSEIASAPHEAQIALLLDYDSLWAVQLQPHHRDFDYLRHLFVYYRALQRLGLPADILSPEADLSRYKLVIAPTEFVATEQLARTLEAFAQGGGTVLLGVRSGFRTPSNQVTDRPLPGLFCELAGVTVSDWFSLPPGVSFDLESAIPGLAGPATLWAESLAPLDSQSEIRNPQSAILARYTSGPFTNSAALTEHQVGAGLALYLGWYPSDSQAESLLAHLAAQAGVARLAEFPLGLVTARRGSHLILLNFTDEPLSAKVHGQPLTVGPRDVKVVTDRG